MKKISVFIVEDDPMVLEVNKGFLEKMSSFELVGSAVSGQDAVQEIKGIQPELVLLDMFLPDFTGLEVLTQLRSERIPSDFIMITAARDAATIREVLRLGAVDYLVKPFRFERFQQALTSYYKMWRKLTDIKQLKQEDIDEWLGSNPEEDQLPKGLSNLTMKQIMMSLLEQEEPQTAEQLAKSLGMARVTVRRYLDYLAEQGKVHVHINYGQVGRPSHYFSIVD